MTQSNTVFPSPSPTTGTPSFRTSPPTAEFPWRGLIEFLQRERVKHAPTTPVSVQTLERTADGLAGASTGISVDGQCLQGGIVSLDAIALCARYLISAEEMGR